MPIGTIRTHLHRGRKKLREALQQRQTQSSIPDRTHDRAQERRATCTTNP
jgi:RNA polymerase sigma-70 factor (ECF subfamily)